MFGQDGTPPPAGTSTPVIREVLQQGALAKEWHPTGPTRFHLKKDLERLDVFVNTIIL